MPPTRGHPGKLGKCAKYCPLPALEPTATAVILQGTLFCTGFNCLLAAVAIFSADHHVSLSARGSKTIILLIIIIIILLCDFIARTDYNIIYQANNLESTTSSVSQCRGAEGVSHLQLNSHPVHLIRECTRLILFLAAITHHNSA